MSQRNSGYARQPRELYEAPAWVTEALLPHLPRPVRTWWECACGSGKMVHVLAKHGFKVWGSDIEQGHDFRALQVSGADIIGTNPPYKLATEFIEHALHLQWPSGMVAMLLPSDFDSAVTRKHLFAEHPAFCKTVVLRKRIKWFDEAPDCYKCGATGKVFNVEQWSEVDCERCKGTGSKASGPSENHNWFIWDWRHKGPSTKAYGP